MMISIAGVVKPVAGAARVAKPRRSLPSLIVRYQPETSPALCVYPKDAADAFPHRFQRIPRPG